VTIWKPTISVSTSPRLFICWPMLGLGKVAVWTPPHTEQLDVGRSSQTVRSTGYFKTNPRVLAGRLKSI
jgi:hypothetical protein